MRNKILSVVLSVIILICCISFTVGAENTANFIMNGAQSEKTVSVNVKTDKLSGVGGIDFILVYDTSRLKLNESSVKCSLENCELVILANGIRVLWDTTDDVAFPEVIISADFKMLSDAHITECVSFVVNEYYDNTLELNDIPFSISFAEADEVERAKEKGSPIFLIVLLIIIAVIVISAAVYFVLANRKIEEIARQFVPERIIAES